MNFLKLLKKYFRILLIKLKQIKKIYYLFGLVNYFEKLLKVKN